jgi:hypothetical protein
MSLRNCPTSRKRIPACLATDIIIRGYTKAALRLPGSLVGVPDKNVDLDIKQLKPTGDILGMPE